MHTVTINYNEFDESEVIESVKGVDASDERYLRIYLEDGNQKLFRHSVIKSIYVIKEK